MNKNYINKDAEDIYDVYRLNGTFKYDEKSKATGFFEMLKICKQAIYTDKNEKFIILHYQKTRKAF